MKRASSKAKRQAVGRSVPTCCSACLELKAEIARMLEMLELQNVDEYTHGQVVRMLESLRDF